MLKKPAIDIGPYTLTVLFPCEPQRCFNQIINFKNRRYMNQKAELLIVPAYPSTTQTCRLCVQTHLNTKILSRYDDSKDKVKQEDKVTITIHM